MDFFLQGRMCESAFAAFGGNSSGRDSSSSIPIHQHYEQQQQQQNHWRLGILGAGGRNGTDFSGEVLGGVGYNNGGDGCSGLMLDSAAQELAFDEDFMQPFEPLAYKSASQNSAHDQPIDRMLLDMSQSDSCLLLGQQKLPQHRQQDDFAELVRKPDRQRAEQNGPPSLEEATAATTPTPPPTAASNDGGYSADDSESGVGVAVGGACHRLLTMSPPATRDRYRLVVELETSVAASDLELKKKSTGVTIATGSSARSTNATEAATPASSRTTTWRRLKSSAGNRLASWRALNEIATRPNPLMATSLRFDIGDNIESDEQQKPWSERAQYSGTLLELFQRSRRQSTGSSGSLLSVAAAAAAAAAAVNTSSSASSTPAMSHRHNVACQFPAPAAPPQSKSCRTNQNHQKSQRIGGPLPRGLAFLRDPLPPPQPGDTSDSGIDTPGAVGKTAAHSTLVCRNCGCRQQQQQQQQRSLKSCLLPVVGPIDDAVNQDADIDSITTSSSSSCSVVDVETATAAAAAAAAAASEFEGFRAKKSVSFCDRPPSAPASAPTGRRSRKSSAAGLGSPAAAGAARARIQRPLSLQLNDLTTNVIPKQVGLYGGDSDSPPLLFHGSPPESPRAVGEKSHRQRLQTLVSDAIRGVNDLLLAVASGTDSQSAAARRLCPPLHGLLSDELLAASATSGNASGASGSSTAGVSSPVGPVVPAVTASSRLAFGVVKNRSHLWQMIEESCKPGPYNTLFSEALRSVRSVSGLSLERLKFNAFVMACLNTRILLSWLVEVARNEALLKRYYRQTAFMRGCHNRYCELFADLTTALELLLSQGFNFDLTSPGGETTASGAGAGAASSNASPQQQQQPPPVVPTRRLISAAPTSQQALKVTRVAGLRPTPATPNPNTPQTTPRSTPGSSTAIAAASVATPSPPPTAKSTRTRGIRSTLSGLMRRNGSHNVATVGNPATMNSNSSAVGQSRLVKTATSSDGRRKAT